MEENPMKISQRAQSIQESPIRKLSAIANAAKARGTTVYHLNIGQPDIATPPAFMERIIHYKEKVLSYGPSDGLEALKTAIAKFLKDEKKDMTMKAGYYGSRLPEMKHGPYDIPLGCVTMEIRYQDPSKPIDPECTLLKNKLGAPR